jgi:hypothetical protein
MLPARALLLVKRLELFLDGDEVEYTGPGGDKSEQHLDDLYWAHNWKVSGVLNLYNDLVHPLLATTTVNILRLLGQRERRTIVEICGGDGALARSILDSAPCKVDYLLLEQNQASIVKARSLLGSAARVIKTDIVNSRKYFIDPERKVALKPASVDIFVGSGALTERVLPSEQAALSALEKIHYYLRPNGFLLLSGLAPSLLNSRHFIQSGFSVINSSVPMKRKEFYILQKNETDIL